MRFFIVGAMIALVFIVSRKAKATTGGNVPVAKQTTLDGLFQGIAGSFGVDWKLIKALAVYESALDPRAYNPETFQPPAGQPRLSKSVPIGFDISGYQGSFGLGQIFHSNSWSTAKAIMGAGNWPNDLLQPELNITIMCKLVKELITKGFSLETIDVYNVGETKYRSGSRNSRYRAGVKAIYDSLA